MRGLLAPIGVIVLAVGSVACGDGDEQSSERAATTVGSEPTTATVEPDVADGAASEPTPVFEMSAEQIADSVEVPRAIGTDVASGLNVPDRELYLAQFQPGAVVIDPIVPSLTPSVGAFFDRFGRAGLLCESWPLDWVYVNLDGALTSGTCVGFYRTLADAQDLPAEPRGVRHLPIDDGLATGLMHRLGVDTMGEHPVQTVVAIGFPDTRAGDLADQVTTATAFIESFEAAWAAADHHAAAQLYADTANRHDGYAGDRHGKQAIADWYERLFDTHTDLAMDVSEVFASGLGPAARYAITTTLGDTPCTMLLGSVWDLDDHGLITDEYVYYDPDTVLTCGWAVGSTR